MKIINLIKFGLALFCCLVLFACAFNKTLAIFDLGNDRVVKIVTGNEMDSNLPIYCQLIVSGKPVDKSVIEYESTGENGVIGNFQYELISDSTKKLFAIIQTAPDTSRPPEAVFDFNEDFGYPVCPLQQCLDCHGGYCAGNSARCLEKSNQILEQIEKDNPNMRLKRYEWNAPKDCGNSK